MENIIKKQAFSERNPKPLPILAMHKQSHKISKPKPKIRIIHIFAPEIIQTDVANFRELVQKLTGKPTNLDPNHQKISKNKNSQRKSVKNHQEKGSRELMTMKMELGGGFWPDDNEAITWQNGIGEQSTEGFFNGFNNVFDGFIQELGEFTFLPEDVPDQHHMHGGFTEAHHQFA